MPDPGGGRVTAIHGDQAAMESRPLRWDGRLLSLGEPAAEMARLTLDGASIAREIAPGDWVSLHWDWICEPAQPAPAPRPARLHPRHLDLVNHRVDTRARRPSWADRPRPQDPAGGVGRGPAGFRTGPAQSGSRARVYIVSNQTLAATPAGGTFS